MCLKNGRIWWYTPGFTGEQPGFDRWASLVNNVKQGPLHADSWFRVARIPTSVRFATSLGSGRRLISTRWLGRARGASARRAVLTVDQGEIAFVARQVLRSSTRRVLRQYPEIGDDIAKGPLEQLISAAGAIRRKQEPAEPHEVLASLDLPVYLSTNPDNLLVDALRARGKTPVFALCPRDDGGDIMPEDVQDLQPTKDKPLVYHLFGHLCDIDSIVLTQDDYFDYLIDVTRNNDIIPTSVRSQLANTALLFLGFQLSDWDFRVFFHIMSQEGAAADADILMWRCRSIPSRTDSSIPNARGAIWNATFREHRSASSGDAPRTS
jgi:hypothetical protein